MIGYYELSQKLKDALITNPLVNSVTKGSLDKITNAKKNMYPLAHVMINDCSFNGPTQVYNVSIICMDILDISKEDVTDLYRGNDNEDDVLHTTLTIMNNMFESLRRGVLSDSNYSIQDDTASCEPFVERFTDSVAGWTMTFNVTIPNVMTIC